jgi:hypothetical protein
MIPEAHNPGTPSPWWSAEREDFSNIIEPPNGVRRKKLDKGLEDDEQPTIMLGEFGCAAL